MKTGIISFVTAHYVDVLSSETNLQLSIFMDALLWQLNDTFVAPCSKRLRKHLDLSWVAQECGSGRGRRMLQKCGIIARVPYGWESVEVVLCTARWYI